MATLRCTMCNGILPAQYKIGSEEAWHMVNAAPHAASGGSMVPMHILCVPKRESVAPPMDVELMDVAAGYLLMADHHLCAGTKKWEGAILLALSDMIRKQTTTT